MTERTNEEIENHIKTVLQEYVAPAVAGHGGFVNFHSFDDGVLLLEMSGSCSGCAMSAATLKYGIENMMTEMVPEVHSVEGFDDPNFNSPFYTQSVTYDYDELTAIVQENEKNTK